MVSCVFVPDVLRALIWAWRLVTSAASVLARSIHFLLTKKKSIILQFDRDFHRSIIQLTSVIIVDCLVQFLNLNRNIEFKIHVCYRFIHLSNEIPARETCWLLTTSSRSLIWFCSAETSTEEPLEPEVMVWFISTF